MQPTVNIVPIPRDKTLVYDYIVLLFDLANGAVYTEAVKGTRTDTADVIEVAVLPRELSSKGAEELVKLVTDTNYFRNALDYHSKKKFALLDHTLDSLETWLLEAVDTLSVWGSADEWFEGAKEETLKELAKLKTKPAFERFANKR